MCRGSAMAQRRRGQGGTGRWRREGPALVAHRCGNERDGTRELAAVYQLMASCSGNGSEAEAAAGGDGRSGDRGQRNTST